MGKRTGNHRRRRRSRRWNTFVRIVRFFLEIILLVFLAACLFVSYKYARMTHDKVKKNEIGISSELSEKDYTDMEGFRTIPIIIVDESGESMEDILIIASIEKENGNVRFASVDSDLWLTEPDGYTEQCSEIYEVDGIKRLVTLLNQNLNLNMTDYICLRECILKETVDRFGGIDVDVTEEEIQSMNAILRISNQQVVEGTGRVHLSGEQAFVYCKIANGPKTMMDRIGEISWKLLLYGEKERLSVKNHVTDEVLYHISTSLGLIDFCRMLRELIVYEIKPYAVMPQDVIERPEQLHRFLYALQ